MRAWAAWQQRETVSELGLQPWLTTYLVSVGLLFAMINFFAWLMLRTRADRHLPVIIFALLLNIVGYWAERLFLWAPSQQGSNSIFMGALHLLWLFLLLLYSTKNYRKDQRDGSGN